MMLMLMLMNMSVVIDYNHDDCSHQNQNDVDDNYHPAFITSCGWAAWIMEWRYLNIIMIIHA